MLKKYKFDAFEIEFDSETEVWQDAFPGCRAIMFQKILEPKTTTFGMMSHLLETQNFGAILSLAAVGAKGIIQHANGNIDLEPSFVREGIKKAEERAKKENEWLI